MAAFTLESDGKSIRGLYTFEDIQDIAHFECQRDLTTEQAKAVLAYIVANYPADTNMPYVIHSVINLVTTPAEPEDAE